MEEKRKTDDIVITSSNVKKLGEYIAIFSMKIAMRYSNGSLDKLYYGLIRDCKKDSSSTEPYSDGYDFAQSAMCFLCNYIGKKLGDTYMVDKQGNKICIRHACYKYLQLEIKKERNCIYSNREINDLNANEPFSDFEQEQELREETNKVDRMIKKMKLSKGEIDTLNCYMGGMTFYDIADFLKVNRSTIYRRRLKLQSKYYKTFGNSFA